MHGLRLSILGIVIVLVIGSVALVFGESEEDMIVPMGTITLSPPRLGGGEAKRCGIPAWPPFWI